MKKELVGILVAAAVLAVVGKAQTGSKIPRIMKPWASVGEAEEL